MRLPKSREARRAEIRRLAQLPGSIFDLRDPSGYHDYKLVVRTGKVRDRRWEGIGDYEPHVYMTNEDGDYPEWVPLSHLEERAVEGYTAREWADEMAELDERVRREEEEMARRRAAHAQSQAPNPRRRKTTRLEPWEREKLERERLVSEVYAKLWEDPEYLRLHEHKDRVGAAWNRADAYREPDAKELEREFDRAIREMHLYEDRALRSAGLPGYGYGESEYRENASVKEGWHEVYIDFPGKRPQGTLVLVYASDINDALKRVRESLRYHRQRGVPSDPSPRTSHIPFTSRQAEEMMGDGRIWIDGRGWVFRGHPDHRPTELKKIPKGLE